MVGREHRFDSHPTIFLLNEKINHTYRSYLIGDCRTPFAASLQLLHRQYPIYAHIEPAYNWGDFLKLGFYRRLKYKVSSMNRKKIPHLIKPSSRESHCCYGKLWKHYLTFTISIVPEIVTPLFKNTLEK